MRKEKKTVGQTTTSVTEKGSMSNEQVINFEYIKEAWMTFAEQCYEDAYEEAIDHLDQTIGFLDKESVIAYLDIEEAAQDFYFAIADCDSMEDYEKIDFVGYIEDMMNSLYVPKQAVVDYAVNNCGIDEEIAEVMINVLKGE